MGFFYYISAMKDAKENEELTGEALITHLKEKHKGRRLYALTTYIDKDENEERVIYLKDPDRATRAAGEKLAQSDGLKGAEVLLRGMYVGGDNLEEIVSDTEALLTASLELIEIITPKKGQLVSL